MMASGVAIPKQASNSITVVIAIAATSPARKPARSALERLMICSILQTSRDKEIK